MTDPMANNLKYLGSIDCDDIELETYWKEQEKRGRVKLVPSPNRYIYKVYAPKASRLKAWSKV